MDTSGVARVIGARGGLQKSHEMPDAPLSPHFFRYHPIFSVITPTLDNFIHQ